MLFAINMCAINLTTWVLVSPAMDEQAFSILQDGKLGRSLLVYLR